MGYYTGMIGSRVERSITMVACKVDMLAHVCMATAGDKVIVDSTTVMAKDGATARQVFIVDNAAKIKAAGSQEVGVHVRPF